MQIEYSQVDSRLFANWSMEYVAYNGVVDQLFAKFSENGLFMPYEFSSGQAVGLLVELSQAAAEANLASKKSLLSWFKK